METINILVIEDSKDDFYLMERILKKNHIPCSLHCVDTRDEFLDALHESNPNLIISDHAMASFSSMDALQICQKERKSVPFLVVTGTLPEDTAKSLLSLGVDNYVLKKDLDLLPDVVKQALKKHKSWVSSGVKNLTAEAISKPKVDNNSFALKFTKYLNDKIKSIDGMTNLMQKESLCTKYRNFHYREIKSQTQQMRYVSHCIKEMAELKLAEVESNVINLRLLTTNVWFELLESRFFDVVLVNNISEELTWKGDVKVLKVILRHIFRNSMLFKDSSKKLNRMKLTAVRQSEYLILEIEDNGIGIEKTVIPKVFDVFYSADTDYKTVGIGLYIVKELLDEIGGEMRITSELKEGTTIQLLLPQYS
ncbi:ATP-binding response regulator [Fulvivirga sediminis]|uniref:histidine kinase n=1 Tax=Fulvivirga sediminis TaxID=2803949 RepID=A0A937FDK6_9BACT|nr:ATP-binding protein [Fulvivirga sediminis]MBL3658458.1 response regulator [Fulvivirga sediminis]